VLKILNNPSIFCVVFFILLNPADDSDPMIVQLSNTFIHDIFLFASFHEHTRRVTKTKIACYVIMCMNAFLNEQNPLICPNHRL